MSERALKVLAGVLAVLVLVWLAISFLPGGRDGAGAPSEALAGFFDGVSPQTVSAVRFLGPDQLLPVELTRTGNEWRVNGFLADSGQIARFWDAVEAAEVGNLVAANPDNHQRMGVAGDSTWALEFTVSGAARSLLIGSPGSRYGTVYVRHPEENDVHLMRGTLRSEVTRDLQGWRNKRVAAVDTSAVWSIGVARSEGGFQLQRADSLWVLEGGEESNRNTVRSLLGEMVRLDATGFYEAGDSLPELDATLTALSQAGDTLLFLEVGGGDGDRWMRVAGDSVTYRTAAYRSARLLPALDQIQGGGS